MCFLKSGATPIVVGIALIGVLLLAPSAQAQEESAYLDRPADSIVEYKRERWSDWFVVETRIQQLGRNDSVRVVTGEGIRLHRGEDHFIKLQPGEVYRVGDALQEGRGILVRLGSAAGHAVGTLWSLITQQPSAPISTTREMLKRTGDQSRRVLLLPEGVEPWLVASASPDLIWFPVAADSLTRVRLFNRASGCQGGELSLDTLVVGSRWLSTDQSVDWTDDTTYRVELADEAGGVADAGCFRLVGREARAALAEQRAQLRANLEGAEGHDPFNLKLHEASLLVHEGYPYDALLLLDRLLEQSNDNDPVARAMWGALLAQTGVLASPTQAAPGSTESVGGG
ncbi:MAG: hypothetical protein AAFQ53_08660 [Bacteroidota bacterium]